MGTVEVTQRPQVIFVASPSTGADSAELFDKMIIKRKHEIPGLHIAFPSLSK